MKKTTRLMIMAFCLPVLAVTAPLQGRDFPCHYCSTTCDELMGQMGCDLYCFGLQARYCFEDEYEFCPPWKPLIIQCSDDPE